MHALGSLAAPVIVVGVAELTLDRLAALARARAASALRTVFADVVLTPLLYLCGALLYVDQAARVGSRRPNRRSKGALMPIFILLSTLTQQGVQTLKSNPERLRAVNKDVEELGCKVLHQWATLGEFDFVNVVEAPDIATYREGLDRACGARLDQDRDAAGARRRGLPANSRIAPNRPKGQLSLRHPAATNQRLA